jgi:hypothetical protein
MTQNKIRITTNSTTIKASFQLLFPLSTTSIGNPIKCS